MNYIATAFVFAFYLTIPQSAFSQNDLIREEKRLASEMYSWANNCVGPCILPKKFLEGGSGKPFILAALKLKEDNKALRVIGAAYCSSACAVLVDKLKSFGGDVCVEKGMLLRFHRAFALEPNPDGSKKYEDTTPTIAVPGAKAWIDANGGIPADGSWIVIPTSIVATQYGYCP
ncbi:hypothetical protein [Methylobacterium sp. B1]|uniref:hypothetical protein n=1 Tax=Methylobacterium sp. B1 TaxID=91459 RepID=UPI0011D26CD5|nr:hypothetical protein [Methylobacterium sp. B1]